MKTSLIKRSGIVASIVLLAVLLASLLVGGKAKAENIYVTPTASGGGCTSNCAFTGTTTLNSTASAAALSYPVNGVIAKLGSITGGSGYTTGTQIVSLGAITAGSGYGDGTYTGVPLTGGTGSSATAKIQVLNGAIVSVGITNRGSGYVSGDTLSASNTNLGGAGSGFSIPVSTAGYAPQALTGGTGSGATANIIVSGGAVTAVALVAQGSGYLNTDILSATIPGGSGFSIPVSTVGGLSAAGVGPFWLTNTMTGSCSDLTNCEPNFFQLNDGIAVLSSANGLRAWYWQENMQAAATGGRTLGFMDLQVNVTPADAGTDRTYQTFQPNVSASVNLGGTSGTPLGHLFSFNPTCKLNSGATYWISSVCDEHDSYVAAGATVLDFGFQQNVIQTAHVAANVSREAFGTKWATQQSSGQTNGLDTILEDGGYSGYPVLKTTGVWGRCYPHANSGNCGTIAGAWDFSGYASLGYFAKLPGSGYVDGSKQTFYGAHGTQSFTPLSTTQNVHIYGCGGGGSGGSGALELASVASSGGGGGGGGGCFDKWFKISDIGTGAQTVTIGQGGTSVAGQTVNTTAGLNGNAGTATCFGGSTVTNSKICGGGGGGGAGGQLAATASGGGGGGAANATGGSSTSAAGGGGSNGFGNSGGGGVAANVTTGNGIGAGGGGSSAAGASSIGASSNMACAGGGSGGGLTSVSGANNGGNGGQATQSTGSNTTAPAGGTSGTPTGGSVTPANGNMPGFGGGGGYGTAATAGNGGAGTQCGGGGGGGTAENGGTAGAGGAGGDGWIEIDES